MQHVAPGLAVFPEEKHPDPHALVAINRFTCEHNFVDSQAAGVIEAKQAGTTLTGVELQAARFLFSAAILT